MKKQTYIINHKQIESVFAMKEYIETIEKAFKLYGKGGVQMPPKVYLTFEQGDLRCMPVYIPSMGFAGVKNVNVHPGNKDMPSVMAVISLIDPETGFPVALMDGTHITNMRTGAAGGVAVKYLSREDAKIAAFVGTGAQAKTQLEALMVVRPNIEVVKAYNRDQTRANAFAEWAAEKFQIKAQGTTNFEEALKDADIVTTTTPVRSPIVKSEWIKAGTHINAIGADAAGKQELEPDILKRASVVIDNWEQASHSGEINVPLSKGLITKDDIAADIGEVVTGKKPGRGSDDQITVFDSTGLAIQDVSSANEIFKKLTSAQEEQLTQFAFLG